jgi:hypothetical protein
MNPFEEKMPRLVADLHGEPALRSFSEGGFADSAKLEQAIKANLASLGFNKP